MERFLGGLGVYFASYIAGVLLHELGHVLAGEAFGLKPRFVTIGRGKLVWSGNVLGYGVRLHSWPLTGLVQCAPENQPGRTAQIAFFAGGPAVNLALMLAFALIHFSQAPDTRGLVLPAVAAGQLAVLINALWPSGNSLVPSDLASIVRLLRPHNGG